MIRPLLGDALGDGSFRFRLGVAPADAVAWLALRSDPARVEARRNVFARHPERLSGSAEELVDVDSFFGTIGPPDGGFEDGARRLAADLFVVRRSDTRVVGIAVAFPSGFAPERLVGRELRSVHAVVPGLEEAIGPQIEGFLARIPAGRSFARVNAGLAGDPGLDRHPAADVPALAADTPLDRLVVRLEEQLFLGLSSHVLFAIHLVIVPFVELEADERRLVARWAGSMPPEVAHYKGITPVMARFEEFTLESGSE